MVVIFGWGAGEAQDLGEVAPVTCPTCHNEVFLHLIRSEKHVSLYFVPIAKTGSNEYLACPICRHGLELRPEHRPAVDRMRAATAAFRAGHVRADYYQGTVEQFWRTLGVAPSGGPAPRPAAMPPPPASAAGGPTVPAPPGAASLAGQLEGLAKLHADGVLTDDEFAEAKRRLLGP